MSKFRRVYRCNDCGKIYRSDYWLVVRGSMSFFCCGECGNFGEIGQEFSKVSARPKLFGLCGWEIRDGLFGGEE